MIIIHKPEVLLLLSTPHNSEHSCAFLMAEQEMVVVLLQLNVVGFQMQKLDRDFLGSPARVYFQDLLAEKLEN